MDELEPEQFARLNKVNRGHKHENFHVKSSRQFENTAICISVSALHEQLLTTFVLNFIARM